MLGNRKAKSDGRALDRAQLYLVMGAYDDDGEQVGFARMVTDFATWAWLWDVFVLPEHQRNGLGMGIPT